MVRLALWCLSLIMALPLPGQPPGPWAVVVRPAAAVEQRVALVIGNGSYREAPLRNPVNDSRAMAAAVRACGFAVTELENASRPQMREAIRAFGARIAAGGVGGTCQRQ